MINIFFKPKTSYLEERCPLCSAQIKTDKDEGQEFQYCLNVHCLYHDALAYYWNVIIPKRLDSLPSNACPVCESDIQSELIVEDDGSEASLFYCINSECQLHNPVEYFDKIIINPAINARKNK